MPAKRRLTMRQLRQMLRLAGSGTSSREIAVVLGIARSTVQDNLQRAAAVMSISRWTSTCAPFHVAEIKDS